MHTSFGEIYMRNICFWKCCTDLTLFWIVFSLCFLTSERNLASNCNYLKQGARFTRYSFPTGKNCYWTLLGNKSTWWIYKRDRINQTWVRKEFKHMRQQVSWSEYHLNTRDTLILENIFYSNKKKTDGTQSYPRFHYMSARSTPTSAFSA